MVAVTNGAAAGGTAAASALGAAAGAGGAAAVTSSSAGAASLTAGIAAGPVGWLVLGAEDDQMGPVGQYKFDCWKQVVHDESTEPSQGKLFAEVVKDSRIKNVNIFDKPGLPLITLENIWGELFSIKYVTLDGGQTALHAELITDPFYL